MMDKKISLVIPNWNGVSLLKDNLPLVVEAAGKTQIIIIDDASKDESVDFLKKKYQQIELIVHSQNKGFAESCNEGVEKASGEIVVLLNTDVVPSGDFLKSIPVHFEDEAVFAVSLGEVSSGPGIASFRDGTLELIRTERTWQKTTAFWASGGQSAFSKEKWIELGGFDPIYKPFYFEDVDLSYRAWKRGYKVLWDPKAVVTHKHIGTIKTHFSKRYVDLIAQRNHLLFIWKNITSPKMINEHRRWLLRKLVFSPGYWQPFLRALVRLPQIKKEKALLALQEKRTDEEIFAMFN